MVLKVRHVLCPYLLRMEVPIAVTVWDGDDVQVLMSSALGGS